ncbi:hypothetical protein GP486_008331 [Trichoglossum hirsutum]|uniref:Uncharacterized protein n=1 Tax=Trichoglossum hirsutum TaxID=265104 RepID=A0A9P8IA39_9PEZI|nr:hypothetical protein GP486_008331 [Trichoglossum hirsutum]
MEVKSYGVQYDLVILQKWYQGAGVSWWTVKDHNSDVPGMKIGQLRNIQVIASTSSIMQYDTSDFPVGASSDVRPQHQPTSNPHTDMIDLQQEEQNRRALVMAQLNTQDPADVQTTYWHRKTGWGSHFHGRPLDIICRTSQVKCKNHHEGRLLGDWRGLRIVSSETVERKLDILMRSTDLVLWRCLETLDSTPSNYSTSDYEV